MENQVNIVDSTTDRWQRKQTAKNPTPAAKLPLQCDEPIRDEQHPTLVDKKGEDSAVNIIPSAPSEATRPHCIRFTYILAMAPTDNVFIRHKNLFDDDFSDMDVEQRGMEVDQLEMEVEDSSSSSSEEADTFCSDFELESSSSSSISFSEDSSDCRCSYCQIVVDSSSSFSSEDEPGDTFEETPTSIRKHVRRRLFEGEDGNSGSSS